MRRFTTFILVALFSSVGFADESIQPRVAKIFSTTHKLNLSQPWKRGDRSEGSGSGIWLGKGRILTNAHVVRYASQISVQPHESPERIPADLIAVSHQMDLAIIELEDSADFDGVVPLEFSEKLPALRTSVQVYGFPEGGKTISITEGVVSRIEHRSYSYSAEGMRIQVDAAINPGNSGGPAVSDGKIIGVAFLKRSSSDNIGYLIPSEEVLTFMKDVEDGTFDGKAKIKLNTQRLLNRGLRSSLNLDREVTGLWIRKVYNKSENYPLKPDDVLTHIGPHDIDNSGTTKLENDVQVSYRYFVDKLKKDGKVPFTVHREGGNLQVEVPVDEKEDLLLRKLLGERPDYFVYGPLVFVEAVASYVDSLEAGMLSSSSRTRAGALLAQRLMHQRKSPLMYRRFDEKEFEGEQLVMVASTLPHRLMIGYQPPMGRVVERINGEKIKNLAHLVELLAKSSDEYIRFEFAGDTNESCVFSREALVDATEDILLDNSIPRQASKELLKLWNEHAE